MSIFSCVKTVHLRSFPTVYSNRLQCSVFLLSLEREYCFSPSLLPNTVSFLQLTLFYVPSSSHFNIHVSCHFQMQFLPSDSLVVCCIYSSSSHSSIYITSLLTVTFLLSFDRFVVLFLLCTISSFYFLIYSSQCKVTFQCQGSRSFFKSFFSISMLLSDSPPSPPLSLTPPLLL